MRYFGGKWVIAPWLISNFPEHRVYVEPYGGGASVLLRKPRVYSEVYNDIDGEIVNVFRVLQNPEQAARLRELLHLTPFARDEFRLSFDTTATDAVELARRTIILSLMGFGADALLRLSTGFRAVSNRSGTTPAHDWRNYPDCIPAFVERLRGVVIENRPALTMIPQHDGEGTLFYVDPPYVHATRSRKTNRKSGHVKAHGYRAEMTDDDHRELAALLKTLRGAVAISGYHSPLYDELYGEWQCVEKGTHADGARDRVEVLYLSPNAVTQRRLMAVGE
jgi:DNA adenine methylase